mgnify:CR=1 FL=1
MKSPLYVANAVQQYRSAIDLFDESPDRFFDEQSRLESNLNRASNRGFTTGSLVSKAERSSISYDWNGYTKSHQFVGFIRDSNSSGSLLQAKVPIKTGASFLYFSPNQSQPISGNIDAFHTHSGSKLMDLKPNECAWISETLPTHSILMQ